MKKFTKQDRFIAVVGLACFAAGLLAMVIVTKFVVSRAPSDAILPVGFGGGVLNNTKAEAFNVTNYNLAPQMVVRWTDTKYQSTCWSLVKYANGRLDYYGLTCLPTNALQPVVSDCEPGTEKPGVDGFPGTCVGRGEDLLSK